MTEPETFPHSLSWHAVNHREGTEGRGQTCYRFVKINAPDGWRTYPGQRCHDDKDGLLIFDEEARWWEQDLWGSSCDDYCLDIGTYGGHKVFVCYAWAPNWHGDLLERIEFVLAEDAAAWAEAWMRDPASAMRSPLPHGTLLEAWAPLPERLRVS